MKTNVNRLLNNLRDFFFSVSVWKVLFAFYVDESSSSSPFSEKIFIRDYICKSTTECLPENGNYAINTWNRYQYHSTEISD